VSGRPVNDPGINVLYFARVAELLGRREETWPLSAPMTCAQWCDALLARYPQLADGKRLKIAVNQQYARDDVVIVPGDEVAVFEPVTGG